MQFESQFLKAIQADLGHAPDHLKGENNIQRFSTKDGKKDDAGWCVYFCDNDKAGGAYGCWRDNRSYKWFSSNCDLGDRIEMQKKERIANAKRLTMEQCEVREKIKEKQLSPLAPTDYTVRKAIDCDDHIIRKKCYLSGNRIMIPMRDLQKTVWNMQAIYPDGTKRFMTGGKTKGLFQTLGSSKSGTCYITEGWATACAVYLSTKKMVVCTFSSGNMLEATKEIASALPITRIIIAADNDQAGEDAARKASQHCNNLVTAPPEVGTDWNDFFVANGAAATQQMIDSRLTEVAVMTPGKPGSGGSNLPSVEVPATNSQPLTAAKIIMTNPDIPEWSRAGLPTVIADAAEATAKVTGSDPVLFSNAALAVMCAAIHDQVTISLKRNENFTEHCQLWCTTMGKSGAGKSPMAKKALAPLKKIAADCAEECKEKAEALKEATEQYKAAQREYRKGELEELPRAPNPHDYQQPRYLLSDATTEAICDIQSKWSGGSLFVADELAALMGSMDRYSATGGKDQGFWLTAFDGGAYTVDRKGEGSSRRVENLSLGLIAGIQPVIAARMFSATGSNGFIERQMIAVARDRTLPDETASDFRELDRWNSLVRRVYDASQSERVLTLSEGADQVRQRLNVWIFEHSKNQEQGMASHLNKFPAIFGRLCIAYHLAENAGFCTDSEVDKDTAQMVYEYLTITQYAHSRAAFNYIAEAKDYPPALLALAQTLEQHPFDTIETEQLRAQSPSSNKSQFNNNIEMLKARGYIIPADELGKGFGFAINPAIKKPQ